MGSEHGSASATLAMLALQMCVFDDETDSRSKWVKNTWRVPIWQLETQLFASSYIWLVYIFKASYSTVVTSFSKKSNVNQSELEK